MKEFAIDLTSIANIESGIGYYTENLLEGLAGGRQAFRAHLILSADNTELFSKFGEDERFRLIRTDCVSRSKGKRLIWVNRHLDRLLREQGVGNCFVPYYCMPVLIGSRTKYYTVIHDLQALHFPQFQSLKQNLWLRLMWRLAVAKAYRIITISDYCKRDIESHYKKAKGKVHFAYIGVSVSKSPEAVFDRLKEQFGIERKAYFYTLSKLRKNKNLGVLIEAYGRLRQRGETPPKLLVSGNNGGEGEQLREKIRENGLEDCVILTGFVSDEERNALYENAKAFLFPSIYEGFGMPVIEAMALGTAVVTTKCTSLYEVTQGKACYVEDPMDADEWIEAMAHVPDACAEIDLREYGIGRFAENILNLIDEG